jgi:hypothetical protein
MVGAVLMIAATNSAPALPDPNSFASIGWVVVIIAGLFVAVNKAFEFFRNVTGKGSERLVTPQPLEVTATKQFVTKEEHDRHVAQDQQEHSNLYSKVGGVERGARSAIDQAARELRTEAKADMNAVHEKINKVDREVGAIAQGMEMQNQQLARIEMNMSNVLKGGK